MSGLATWVQTGIVVAGFALAMGEYNASRQEVRVERSLAFVERAQTGELADSIEQVTAASLQLGPKLEELFEAQSLSDAQRREAFATMTRQVFEDFGLNDDALKVATFYDTFAVCQRVGACDCQTGMDLFGESMRTQYIWIAPIITAHLEATRTQNFGQAYGELATRAYVQAAGGAPACQSRPWVADHLPGVARRFEAAH